MLSVRMSWRWMTHVQNLNFRLVKTFWLKGILKFLFCSIEQRDLANKTVNFSGQICKIFQGLAPKCPDYLCWTNYGCERHRDEQELTWDPRLAIRSSNLEQCSRLQADHDRMWLLQKCWTYVKQQKKSELKHNHWNVGKLLVATATVMVPFASRH